MARMEIIKRQSGAPPSSSAQPQPTVVDSTSSNTPSSTPSSVITTPSSTPSSTPSEPSSLTTPTSTPPSPTTTDATTPTPQSSLVTAQGSPTTVTSTQPPRSTIANSIISTTSTSVFTSVMLSTEPNGVIVTTTIRSTIIIVPTSASSGSSSNTGAIIGGVAGGIAALLAVFIIGLFYWRRNRRRDDFDGNFDPDRVVRHAGDADLAGGAEVTPYHYEPGAGQRSGPSSPTFSADSSMRQYRESQSLLGGNVFAGGVATATSGSHYAPTSSDGASAHPESSGHGRSSSLGSSGIAQPYHPMSAKEREAMRQRGDGLGLTTAPEEAEGDVIQHSDGGRIPEPVPPSQEAREIPPSYDSIPANNP